jgi:hypothetical protein
MLRLEPRQLIDALEREPRGYAELLQAAGDAVAAGHTLAMARLSCWHSTTAPVPTVTELHVAIRDVCARAGYLGSVPSRRESAMRAARAGLPIMSARRVL